MNLENSSHGLLAATYLVAASSALVVVGWSTGNGDSDTAGHGGHDSASVTGRHAGPSCQSHRLAWARPPHRRSFVPEDRAEDLAALAAWSRTS
jgi:hypothetical protein